MSLNISIPFPVIVNVSEDACREFAIWTDFLLILIVSVHMDILLFMIQDFFN